MPEQPKSSDARMLAIVVVGILIAAAVIFAVYSLASSSSELDCRTKNFERARDGQSQREC